MTVSQFSIHEKVHCSWSMFFFLQKRCASNWKSLKYSSWITKNIIYVKGGGRGPTKGSIKNLKSNKTDNTMAKKKRGINEQHTKHYTEQGLRNKHTKHTQTTRLTHVRMKVKQCLTGGIHWVT